MRSTWSRHIFPECANSALWDPGNLRRRGVKEHSPDLVALSPSIGHENRSDSRGEHRAAIDMDPSRSRIESLPVGVTEPEDIVDVFQTPGGYRSAEADKARSIVGHTRFDTIPTGGERLLGRCIDSGVPSDVSTRIRENSARRLCLRRDPRPARQRRIRM